MSNQWHGGKGDSPRKQSNQKAYEDGWERIFGKRDSSKSKGDTDKGGSQEPTGTERTNS